MSAITLELPNSLHKKLEELASNGGFSVEQFLASAASEKVSAMLQREFLENEAKMGQDVLSRSISLLFSRGERCYHFVAAIIAQTSTAAEVAHFTHTQGETRKRC